MRPVNVVEVPNLPPGTCVKCLCTNTPNRDYFVDIGVDLEFGGVIYICNMCLLDIVNHTDDFFSKKQVDALVDANSAMMSDAARALDEQKEVHKALESVGIDVPLLLKNAKKLVQNMEKLPERNKELAEAKLFAQVAESRARETEAKLKSLEQYIGSEELLTTANKSLGEVTHERNLLLQEKAVLLETIERLSQPPVKETPAAILGGVKIDIAEVVS